jgi:hypothetical protein
MDIADGNTGGKAQAGADDLFGHHPDPRAAKRQPAWFRADPEIVWPAAHRPEELVRLSEEFLNLA